MFTLGSNTTKEQIAYKDEALKKIQDYKDKYMDEDNWKNLSKEEKHRRVLELLALTEEITKDQTKFMDDITKGRAGKDFFKGPMEWVRKVDVCKSDRLKFDIIVLIPMFIKVVLVAACLYIIADIGMHPLVIPVGLGIIAIMAYFMRDLVRIAKCGWIMGYVIGCVDTGAPLIRMYVNDEARNLADQLMQVSLQAISESQLKRYQVMVNTHKIPDDKFPALGVKDGEELYGKLMIEEPKQATIK